MSKQAGKSAVRILRICLLLILVLPGGILAGCSPESAILASERSNNKPSILAVESFLADIAQNIAGNRMDVTALIAPGIDAHSYELVPQDVVALIEADLIIINGAGYESWLNKTLKSAQIPKEKTIEASAGLTPHEIDGEVDPHFWMDPNLVIQYANNIRDAMIKIDPAGEAEYTANTEYYVGELNELDSWIRNEVLQLPEISRVLVTNHESFGYFNDRYGFRLAGSLLVGISSEQSPSAQQVTSLVNIVNTEHVKAVFIEAGSNNLMARQIAEETGIRVISDLHIESLSLPQGSAATYIKMIQYDVNRIVEALK